MANLLFIGNPQTSHDLKVMRWFASKPEHKVFLLSYPLAWRQLGNESKIELEKSGIHLLGPIDHFSSRNFIRTGRQARVIQTIIRQHQISGVCILYLTPGALWANYRKRWNVPVVLWAYGTDVNDHLENVFSTKGFFARREQQHYLNALGCADAVLSFSRSMQEKLKALQPGIKRMMVLRSGVASQRLREWAGKPPAELQGRPYLLFPRYMRPVYNHELTLDAIRLLPPEIREKYTMVFIDRDSTEREYVADISAQMGKMSDVNFLWLPAQDQEGIWSLTRSASLVVMNPHTDGAPVSAMEAMAAGVPLLLGAAPYDEDLFSSIPKLTSEDPGQLAVLILQALQSPADAAQISSAQKTIGELADTDREMHRLEKLFEELAKS